MIVIIFIKNFLLVALLILFYHWQKKRKPLTFDTLLLICSACMILRFSDLLFKEITPVFYVELLGIISGLVMGLIYLKLTK